jgi:Domain of unknown function (DUF5753)
VPLSLGAHPGLDNTFTLLEFRPLQTPLIYIENMAGTLYLEKASDVERYREALMHLQAGALDPDSSMALIERTRDAFGGRT